MNFENVRNVVPETVNYFISNDANSNQDFQKIPISSEYTRVTPIYDDQNNKENNSILKPVSYYTYLTNNINNNSAGRKGQTNVKYYYSNSPQRKKREKSRSNILSSFNHDKNDQNIMTNSPYQTTNYMTYITQNDNNKYRSRSPIITRKNNYLINDNTQSNISTFCSRSPNTPLKNINNNYNIISTYIPDTTSLNDNIIVNNLPSDYHNFSNDYELLYPNASNNEIITTQVYNVNATSPGQNNTYSTLTSNNTKSTDLFLNNLGSNTYQAINIPGNTNTSNYQEYSYVPYPNLANISNYNNSNNVLYTPTKTQLNTSQYISYPLNSINTIPSTNKYVQLLSQSPNSANINSIPSSSEMLISNNFYSNQNLSNLKNYNSPNNNVNTNITGYNSRNNLYSKVSNNKVMKKQTDTPVISNFNKNNIVNKYNNNMEAKHQRNYSPSFCNDINSNSKNYIIEKNETGPNTINLEEGINTNINNINKMNTNPNSNINSPNKISNKSNYYKESSSLLNKNKYNIKSNLIKNISSDQDKVENGPTDYFSQYMYTHINNIRTNPKGYIPTIQNAMNNISTDKKGRMIYKGKLKVALFKGKEAFEEAISDLQKMDPMEPLVFKKELCVEISEKEKEFKSGDYLRNKIKEKVDNGIQINAFWRDIIKDPEINLLLMIVDDNAIKMGYKRRDILDPKKKYIGINSGKLDDKFVCYTVLSE